MVSVFEQRYGLIGEDATSLTSIGAQHGFSAPTAQYHLRRMLAKRDCITLESLPSMARAKELILAGADLPDRLTGGVSMRDLLRLGHDLFDPIPPAEGGRQGAGAKPRASHLRITGDQFDCLVDLAAFRHGAAVPAARRVMVDGLTMSSVAREAGLTQQQVNNVRARVAALYSQVVEAYGCGGSVS